MLKYNRWIYHTFKVSLLILLEGCSCNFLDPTLRSEVSRTPGEAWAPRYNEWYCPRLHSSETFFPDAASDSTIEKLLDIALQNHPLTKQAWALARAEAFAVGASESARYPTLTNTENVIFNEFSSSKNSTSGGGLATTGSTTTTYSPSSHNQSVESSLLISYLLLDFGGREASIQSTRYALQAMNWSQNKIIQQVLVTTLQGYYNYINSKEMLKARKDDLENAKVNLSLAEELHRVGIGRLLDLLQAQANAENALLNLITAQNQIKIDLGALATALGLPPSTEFEAKDLPEHFPVDDVAMTLSELMEAAKHNRPDLAEAYATILQKKMDYISTVSSAFPSVTSSIDLTRDDFFNHTGTSRHNYTGMISLNVPIFSGFLYMNQIRGAKENIKAAEENFTNLENAALLDVVTAYYTFMTNNESLKSNELYLKYSQEAYALALATYKTGAGSMIDLLLGQTTLSNAKALYINSKTSWAASLFNIAFAAGALNSSFVAQKMKSVSSIKNTLTITQENL